MSNSNKNTIKIVRQKILSFQKALETNNQEAARAAEKDLRETVQELDETLMTIEIFWGLNPFLLRCALPGMIGTINQLIEDYGFEEVAKLSVINKKLLTDEFKKN